MITLTGPPGDGTSGRRCGSYFGGPRAAFSRLRPSGICDSPIRKAFSPIQAGPKQPNPPYLRRWSKSIALVADRIARLPLFFPVNRGFVTKRISHTNASSAIQSLLKSFFLDQESHQLLPVVRGREEFRKHGPTHAIAQAAQQTLADVVDRGNQDGPTLEPAFGVAS